MELLPTRGSEAGYAPICLGQTDEKYLIVRLYPSNKIYIAPRLTISKYSPMRR